MNYRGCVSSVNTTLWTFELDNKVTVHMGHLAVHNVAQRLPEIGEEVQVYNAHYSLSKLQYLEKLFLCDQSVLECNNYKTYIKEDELLQAIKSLNLGVSDLLEIDYNIPIIGEVIKGLTEQSSEQILFEVVRCIGKASKDLIKTNSHKCLNRIIPSFTLKTISSCRYVDLQPTKEIKSPPWGYGTHSKTNKWDILIGSLQINKRFGIILLHDTKYNMPCLITSRNKSANKNNLLNKFVLVKDYRVFTETYRECDRSLEYVLFDVEDVIVLDLKLVHKNLQQIYDTFPNDAPYVYNFEFLLLKKASVSIDAESKIECWLNVLIMQGQEKQHSYLGLNAYQVQIVPFLKEGESYQVYHCEKLKDHHNIELLRLGQPVRCQKFIEKSPIFVRGRNKNKSANILSVMETIEEIKTSHNFVSFQGLLSVKKFTRAVSSRTRRDSVCVGFGTPGSKTHTLVFVDDTQEHNLCLYLNNWENLQIPLGLIPFMRICVRNVIPQKGLYLKSTPFTTFEVLNYEPAVLFDTANLSSDPARGCDKYSFLGWGNLLPCNVLIWARVTQLYIRSLKIVCRCEGCNVVLIPMECCSCEAATSVLETTITLFVNDQMGQALVISKCVELLRLLLGLEPLQWSVWCSAFESVGQYIHDSGETMFSNQAAEVQAFSEALVLAINVINVTKISDLEFKCRKMESSVENNDGMPVWFCVDARKQQNFEL